ncbi:MAG: hypothetical protein E7J30_03975 [Veillonella parvula]|nr:hypothetical protein [Veillonella parvula]
MKKLLFKSVLSAMAVGLLCAGYVSADVVNDSISTDNVGVSAAVTFDMPRVHPDSAIKALPRKTLLEWPMKTQEGARNWKGIVEAAQQLSYEVKAPSYIPYGYQLYTARQDRNDVLEVVYYKKGVTIYRDGKKILNGLNQVILVRFIIQEILKPIWFVALRGRRMAWLILYSS